ncbi:MAG TPA: hypothetical protein VFF57_02260, partial [Hanamia sp.]|nr:hypothetical protein [Hanamia sp.]
MSTRLVVLFLFSALLFGSKSFAQIDLNNLDLKDLIGKVVHVQKGFAPKFSLGKTPIEKIAKVQEILGLKQNVEVNRLFKTFKTGRTIYKVAAYAGGAIAVYSLARKLDNSVKSNDYNGALYSGISAIGTGLVIKFLTKGASYKA